MIGETYEIHGIDNIEDVINDINIEEEKITKFSVRETALEALVDKTTNDLSMNLINRKKQATEDLIQKYCYLNYKSTIHICRIYATERNIRRPWVS